MTFRNKKLYPFIKKNLVKKFPVKELDYPNLKTQNDLNFYY